MNEPLSMAVFGEIETQRLLLRQLRPEDTEFIFQHFKDPEVTRYLVDAEPFETRQEAEGLIKFFERYKETGAYRWAITLKEEETIIGTIGYLHWDSRNHSAEIGFDLARRFWGGGIMREAMEPVLKSGFEKLELNRIWGVVHTENLRSIKTLEALDFKREGIFREFFYFRGKYYDHFCYSLLKREWLARHPNERRA